MYNATRLLILKKPSLLLSKLILNIDFCKIKAYHEIYKIGKPYSGFLLKNAFEELP